MAFPGNVNTAEPSPGPCTHSEPGLCSGTGSAECYRDKEEEMDDLTLFEIITQVKDT